MENDCLIATIGNRDLQIPESKYNNLDLKFKQYFKKNNDNDNFYIINKESGVSFYEISKMIFENFEYFFDIIKFPMLESSINNLLKKEKNIGDFYLISTNQENPDRQDTFYFGEFIKEYFKRKKLFVNIENKVINLNPTKIKNLLSFFGDFFEELKNKNYNNIYIEFSGGTPQIRIACFNSGIFFKNVVFFEVERGGNVNFENSNFLRKKILKEKVIDMLNVYDFEGIRRLNMDDKIDKICNDAILKYNFNKTIEEKNNYEVNSIESLILLFSNLEVSYIQKRYVEVINRIFRIEESVWYLLLYRFLKREGLINERDKFKRLNSEGEFKFDENFNKLISQNFFENFYYCFFKDEFVYDEERRKYYFKKFKDERGNFLSVDIGKNFYYYFFKSLGIYGDILIFFEKINIDEKENGKYYTRNSKLNNLRNKSIAGHGFKEVNLKDIELITGNFEIFLKDLKNILIKEELVGRDFENIFRLYKKNILEELEKE